MTQRTFHTEPYMRARLEANGRRLGFRAGTLEAWRIWQSELRALLLESDPDALNLGGPAGADSPQPSRH